MPKCERGRGTLYMYNTCTISDLDLAQTWGQTALCGLRQAALAVLILDDDLNSIFFS
jgi:hypothetical protein